MYEQIASNKRRTLILIILFIAFIIGAGYIFSRLFALGPIGLIIAGSFAFIMVFSSYYYSDKIVLKASRARPLEHNEYPHLDNTIEGLAIAAGIPKPKAYIIDDMAPNAFATGRNPENAVIAVTKGLVEKMNREELEGVIAHEMSHIKNFDIRLMAIVSVLVGFVILMADWFRYSMWFGGIGDDDDNSLGIVVLVVGLILAVVAPLFAMLIQFAVSRRREFLADASGAMLTRYPDGLAKALKKLATDNQQLKAASNATAHLFIVNPFKKFAVSNLFSTHPPIEERIKRLEEM
jgi:heat shock protein HtpX